MKKIAVIHTSMVLYENLKALFSEIIPESEIINIIDDSLLSEVSKAGHVTPGIINRMSKYFDCSQSLGVDLIITQCSSVGEAALAAAKSVSVPLLRIDEAMAEKAVAAGRRIGVVATVKSTVEPSCNLVQSKADLINKQVEIVPYLVDGALDVLMREGREKHNALVIDTVKKCADECDVVVLAQGSMTALLPLLKGMEVPVFTSLESGIRKARELLYGN